MVGVVASPVVENLPTQIPASSVVPKVNAGWVNQSPLVVPLLLVASLSSNFIAKIPDLHFDNFGVLRKIFGIYEYPTIVSWNGHSFINTVIENSY